MSTAEFFSTTPLQSELYLSPIGDLKCVWYRLKLETYMSSRYSSGWQIEFEYDVSARFTITDQSGSLAIDPQFIEILEDTFSTPFQKKLLKTTKI